MFNLFKPKKTYCMVYKDFYENRYRDIVRAKNIVDAWNKAKNRSIIRTDYCISITELEDDKEFKLK